MSRDAARFISSFLIIVLFIGTLMPGSWKDSATKPFPTTIDLAALAHIAIFAGICFTALPARFWNIEPWHVLALGLALALLTEGLQFFAVERHPNLAGVTQDMIGAFVGWGFGRMRTSQAQPVAGSGRDG
jgi:hypothetical protein